MNQEINSEQLNLEALHLYARDLYFNQNFTASEVKNALLKNNVEEDLAAEIISKLEKEFRAMRSDEANKQMLYGIFWCAGGIAATAADIGYIFWGAIVFGAVKFFKGLMMN
jgi:hypothetical protein